MIDLRNALIIFGVLLVLAVWLYNRWQEKRFLARRRLTTPSAPDKARGVSPPQTETDHALPGQRIEPSLTLPPQPAGAAAPEPSFMDADLPIEPEPSLSSGEEDLLLDIEAESPPPLPAEWGDGCVDALVRIEFVAPAPIRMLFDEYREGLERLDKPVHWLGLDEDAGRWRTLLPDDTGSVKHLAIALQLVDRLGAVSAETLAAFLAAMNRLAQRFDGRFDPPDTNALLARAQELDAFCASVDLQLTLHLLPKDGALLSGARLKPLLDRAGLRLDGERFVASQPDGREAFAVLCRAASGDPIQQLAATQLTELIFTLDVPRVAAGAQAFERLLDLARQCAASLDGQLADAHRKPLANATLAIIRSRIVELQQRMIDRGIVPGGVRASRLFAG